MRGLQITDKVEWRDERGERRLGIVLGQTPDRRPVRDCQADIIRKLREQLGAQTKEAGHLKNEIGKTEQRLRSMTVERERLHRERDDLIEASTEMMDAIPEDQLNGTLAEKVIALRNVIFRAQSH